MDGYSTADDDWSVGDGADAFPSDDTQWSDWDEDGFGDNYGNLSWIDRIRTGLENTINTQRQDACPLYRVILARRHPRCPDGDGDGWADFMDVPC